MSWIPPTLTSLLVQSEIPDSALGVLSVAISLGSWRRAEARLSEQSSRMTDHALTVGWTGAGG
jgi:hypothetical protein